MSKPIIAYISQALPNLTETFVYREIFALREQGFSVIPLSIHAPKFDNLSAETRDLAQETTFVFPLNRLGFVRAHLHFLLTRPVQYWQTFFFVMTRPGESLANRRRTLYHFAEAIFLAITVQRMGVTHVHAHFSVNAATIALVLARLLNISFSFTVHNNIFTDRLILLEKIQAAKFIAVISEYSRDYLLDWLGDYPQKEQIRQKFHIIHCGVDPQRFTPLESRPPRPVPQILSVAQFAERKGMPYLVEACHLLKQRGCQFTCIIGGGGAQRAELEQLIETYQLAAVVKLPGVIYQEDLITYLNQTDIFAMACITAENGDMDGIPVALMEAMAMEIATVSTYVSGIPELIDHEQTGLLVPEKDVVALADALQRLIENEPYRAQLGQQARAKIVTDFNIHHTSQQITTLFE